MRPDAVVSDRLRVCRGNRTVLDEVSLRIPAGVLAGVLGPSGCGKTTLLRAVVGVQRIRSGHLSVLGSPCGDASLRSRIGYMSQALAVYLDLSARDNLLYLAVALRIPRVERAPEVQRVLATVDLTAWQLRPVGRLSGGQRSRVSLAAALLGRPHLLVLDEPTVGLDPLLRAQLWRVFEELASSGTSVVLSSHALDETDRCDWLVLLREGRLLYSGSRTSLLDDTGTQHVGDAFLTLLGAQVPDRSAVGHNPGEATGVR